MPKFSFRLQKLLSLRRRQEEGAKQEYLDAQARRLEGERQLERSRDVRTAALRIPAPDISALRARDAYFLRLDDLVRADEAALAVLFGEEEVCKQRWIAARQEAEGLGKLRENAFREWTLEVNRREQNELDEWAITRRAA